MSGDSGSVNQKYARYIRDKVNQLLQVMGTFPLKPEELDDETLLDLDPIGIIADSFGQILEHMRETNRELTMARDQLQAIFDATGVGISIIDNDFRIINCNEKQRELLVDKSLGDVRGRHCYEVYCGKGSPGLDCPAIDTLATGRSVVVREVEKKGNHFQIVTSPFKDSDGNIVGAIEVLLNINEKKKTQELYHRAEKLVALGQLSAGIAHELNTPLGSILGYARLMMKDKNLDETQRERLSVIAEQAKRGSAIISGLLSFARQSNSALKDAQKEDINAVISDVLKMLGTEMEKRNIKLIAEFKKLPPVKMDRRQMEQVIINLLLNAVQALDKDGWIKIRTGCGGGFLKIEIEDNGPGIGDDIKDKIFEPFFTTKPVGQGTGLGLFICSGIVSEHGGSIHVESSEEGGALFTITLPLDKKM